MVLEIATFFTNKRLRKVQRILKTRQRAVIPIIPLFFEGHAGPIVSRVKTQVQDSE